MVVKNMMSYELERIEELCRERGWSHYRLALEMDTSPNNIGNLFRRTTVPSIPTIRRICEVMGITMAQFYSTDGVQVTLNEQQRRIMDLYDKLDPLDKSKAEAYMEGLSAKAKGYIAVKRQSKAAPDRRMGIPPCRLGCFFRVLYVFCTLASFFCFPYLSFSLVKSW